MLFERDVELRRLASVVASVADYAPATSSRSESVVFLEGPAGIGKSALLRSLAGMAVDAGFEVLQARGSELERSFSYGLARQMLRPVLAAASKHDRELLLAGAAADALSALGERDGRDGYDDGLRAVQGLYWLSVNLAAQRPLALVVDDAHWVDSPSLRWLVHTAARTTGLPLLLAVGARSGEPEVEQDLLDALALSEDAVILRPCELSAAGVAKVVDETFDGPRSEMFELACHQVTKGNPLLVRELLRELSASGLSPRDELAGGLADYGHDAIGRIVRRRLSQLGADPVRVARAAAVLGDGAVPGDIAVLIGATDAQLRHAAATLARAGVLVDDPELSFVHPLVRSAVYVEIPATLREAMHRDAARITPDVEVAASHLLLVGPRGEPWVVDTLLAAADQAARRGAPGVAASLLERALREPPDRGPQRVRVLRALGAAEAITLDIGFHDHLQAAIDETADDRERLDVSLLLGEALTVVAANDAAVAAFAHALVRLPPDDPAAAVVEGHLLIAALSDVHTRELAGDRWDRWIARLDAGEPVPPEVLAPLAGYLLDRPPTSRAVALADRALDRGGKEIRASLVHLAFVLAADGQFARAGQLYDAGIAAARRGGSSTTLAWALLFRSDISLRQGDVRRAETEIRTVLRLASPEQGGASGRGFIAAIAARILVARGLLDEADAVLARWLPQPPVLRSSPSEYAITARAALRTAQGRTAEAVADLRLAATLFAPGEMPNPIQHRWRGQLAEILAAGGDRGEARQLARSQVEDARHFGVPVTIGVALIAVGEAEGGSVGVESLREAVATLARTEARLDHARALVRLGALLRRCGSKTEARETLRLGLDLAARCGATPLADEAHEELVSAGARPRQGRRLLSGPESLTAGEHRVAQLAAQGLTNREIAQLLYVTQSAVQWHLRNAFRKLGVSARAELAVALAG